MVRGQCSDAILTHVIYISVQKSDVIKASLKAPKKISSLAIFGARLIYAPKCRSIAKTPMGAGNVALKKTKTADSPLEGLKEAMDKRSLTW